MSEQNKALYRKFVAEVIDKKNLAVLDELVASNFVDHNPIPDTPATKEGMKQGITMLHSAFPDLKSPVTFLVAEGDLVVGHHTTTGTHQGEFMGIPATGKKIQVDEIHIVRIDNGKAVEHWGLVEDMAMMQQLGVAQG